ncbi:hypothetical protein [Mammaliicoccus sp. N-M50]|uniref:hypothetical protein n=1 Tax=Mammaliicoccus sp. N-M50 TaxID=2898709 RepID=UPI001EFA8AB2|nr:hypothetical protein [Mammaliicoccus sp. N-M50]
MINLTSEARKELYNTLTDEKIKILDIYHKKTKRSIFFNGIFEEDDGWIIKDLQINLEYGNQMDDSQKLYCDKCGKELKYQYIIGSTHNYKIHKLGISCLSQHLGVPKAVATEVHNRKLKIDEWLDDILYNLNDDYTNECVKNIYQTNDDSVIETIFNSKEQVLVSDFIKVDLPLPSRLQEKLINYENTKKKKELEAKNEIYRKEQAELERIKRNEEADEKIDKIFKNKREKNRTFQNNRGTFKTTKKNKNKIDIHPVYQNLSAEEKRKVLMIIASCRMNIWNVFKYNRNKNEILSLEYVFGNKTHYNKLLSYFTIYDAIQEIINSVLKYHDLKIIFEHGFKCK